MIAALANLCALGIIWGVCFAFVMFLATPDNYRSGVPIAAHGLAAAAVALATLLSLVVLWGNVA